jgi:antirestriction protein ArdC
MKKIRKDKLSSEERITNSIIELIENNETDSGIDWVKVGLRDQHNHLGKEYNELNSLILSEEANRMGYTNTQWLTFQQIKKAEGNVKGQRSTYIVLSFPLFKKDKNNKYVFDKNGDKILNGFRKGGCAVFNIEQTGLTIDPKFNVEDIKLDKVELSVMTKSLIEDFPVEVYFSGNEAFYNPNLNFITLPKKDQFVSEEALISVLLHEMSHSTGHKDWLNRDGINGKHKFGSTGYAKEELVAELSAAMICSKLGIEYKLAYHASYIQNWLSILKNDSNYIFKASRLAKDACIEVMKYVNKKKLKIAA